MQINLIKGEAHGTSQDYMRNNTATSGGISPGRPGQTFLDKYHINTPRLPPWDRSCRMGCCKEQVVNNLLSQKSVGA